MAVVMVLDPAGQLLQHSQGVGPGLNTRIVALQSFDERLADAITLWAAHRLKQGTRDKAAAKSKVS
jgi:hypothetical protein